MTVWTCTITIRDEKAQTSNHRFYFNDQGGVGGPAEVLELAQEYARLLDQFIRGAIVGVSATANINLPTGIKATPDTTSDVEEGIRIWYAVTGGAQDFDHRIPTFREDLLASPTSLVDYYAALGLSGTEEDPFELLGLTQDWNGAYVASGCDSRGAGLRGQQRVKEEFKRSRR